MQPPQPAPEKLRPSTLYQKSVAFGTQHPGTLLTKGGNCHLKCFLEWHPQHMVHGTRYTTK